MHCKSPSRALSTWRRRRRRRLAARPCPSRRFVAPTMTRLVVLPPRAVAPKSKPRRVCLARHCGVPSTWPATVPAREGPAAARALSRSHSSGVWHFAVQACMAAISARRAALTRRWRLSDERPWKRGETMSVVKAWPQPPAAPSVSGRRGAGRDGGGGGGRARHVRHLDVRGLEALGDGGAQAGVGDVRHGRAVDASARTEARRRRRRRRRLWAAGCWSLELMTKTRQCGVLATLCCSTVCIWLG